jgi:hypothetical protein
MFDKDFNELLSIFNDHKVKYLVVGGYAVGFHADVEALRKAAHGEGPQPAKKKTSEVKQDGPKQ